MLASASMTPAVFAMEWGTSFNADATTFQKESAIAMEINLMWWEYAAGPAQKTPTKTAFAMTSTLASGPSMTAGSAMDQVPS